MKLVHVVPELKDWHRLRDGIDRVNKHSAPHLRQTFEQVSERLIRGTASWFAVVDDTLLADLIVQTLQEDDRRVLYVWLMFGAHLSKWAKFATEQLNEVAIHNGCDRVRFHTTRDKWIHLVTDVPEEWEHTHVFTRKVTYGRSI